MVNSIALPRKKRRRPPGFWFWYNLFFLLWDITFAVYDLFHYLMDNHIISLIGLGGMIACGYIQWPLFKREYDKWKDGE